MKLSPWISGKRIIAPGMWKEIMVIIGHSFVGAQWLKE